MSSTVISSSNFQFIFNAALAEYREHTGVDLLQYPYAEKLPLPLREVLYTVLLLLDHKVIKQPSCSIHCRRGLRAYLIPTITSVMSGGQGCNRDLP